MKKGKGRLRKGIIGAGTVAVSFLANSCDIDHSEYNHEDSQYDALWKSSYSDKGGQLLNINELQLSDKIHEYAQILGILIEDVTKNESSARLFCSDPNAYLAQKKIDNIDVNLNQYLTDKDKRAIMAFADKEIREAAKQKNLSEFIFLCKSKGLLSSPVSVISKGYADYSRFFKSPEDYISFVNHVNSITNSQEFSQAEDAFALVLVLVAGFRVGAYYDDYVYEHTEFWGYNAPMQYKITNALKEEPALRFWIKEHENTYIPSGLLFDELVLQRATDISRAVAEQYPNYDEEKLKEFIALNLQNFYNLQSE